VAEANSADNSLMPSRQALPRGLENPPQTALTRMLNLAVHATHRCSGPNGPLVNTAPPNRRRVLAMVVLFLGVLVVVACGGHQETQQTQGSRSDTAISHSLNPLTVDNILSSIGKAGLAVPNPRDVTQRDCPEIGCANKVETDTVSIIKFPTPGKAQLYAGSTQHVFQIEDVVMTFTSLVPTSAQPAYEEAVKRAIG
jgi:hypothetical protein